jgi:heme/copper-type cytochrome/quinol oxidase subunit 2
MEETNQNFQSLKKGIKDFMRTQTQDKKKKWKHCFAIMILNYFIYAYTILYLTFYFCIYFSIRKFNNKLSKKASKN